MNHFIVYCSPNGSTRHVAEVISQRLAQFDAVAEIYDIGQKTERQKIEKLLLDGKRLFCLWIGSPVYVDHMVPPVESFISSLRSQKGNYAVPFVTWGAVNSGTALYEMGKILMHKKFSLLGAAKVIGVHSSMWKSPKPLGAGHPNSEDDSLVRSLVEKVFSKLSKSPDSLTLSLEALNYQPLEIQQEARRKSIATAKQLYPPLMADVDRCTQCAECAEKCPADAITLDPYPQVSDECFLCLKCVRECPENAIPWDVSAMEKRIRGLAAASKEPSSTQIFV